MDMPAKQQVIANNEITLNIRANPEYLSVARAAVRAVTNAIGMDKETAEKITVATVEAITNVIKHSYGGPCEKTVVVKLGKIKYQCQRSSAGHNGVESIMQHLKTKNFCRLRFGVDRPAHGDPADYVLQKFTEEEWQVVKDIMPTIDKYVMEFIEE